MTEITPDNTPIVEVRSGNTISVGYLLDDSDGTVVISAEYILHDRLGGWRDEEAFSRARSEINVVQDRAGAKPPRQMNDVNKESGNVSEG